MDVKVSASENNSAQFGVKTGVNYPQGHNNINILNFDENREEKNNQILGSIDILRKLFPS